MVSYEKNKTIFEIPSSFQIETVCFFSCANGATILFLFCVHFRVLQTTVQCIQCQLTLVLLSMDSYEAADNRLKNQSYVCLASIFAIGSAGMLLAYKPTSTRVSLLQDQSPLAKNSPATATRLTKHEHLVYIYVEQAFLYSYIQY